MEDTSRDEGRRRREVQLYRKVVEHLSVEGKIRKRLLILSDYL
jgi:hypothetical protein